MILSKGYRLGPYEILEPLGAGGMGEVYKARDTRLDRVVAVKVLAAGIGASPELRARFEREAKAVSQLSHPHICALFDIRREGDIDFLVMEFVEGRSLADRIGPSSSAESGNPLDVDEALRYAVQIAGALSHAHQRGVIHRDLKPANVMLSGGGVKLLDFGLAKLKKKPLDEPLPPVGEVTLSLDQTANGLMVGTVPYMAPEQLEGAEADARSDIFALGAVIYEMVTGRRAFGGRSPASIIAAIMSYDPPLPSSVRPLTPPALDHIVQRCLAKDPSERWQTAQDVAAELRWIAEERRLTLTPSDSQIRSQLQVQAMSRVQSQVGPASGFGTAGSSPRAAAGEGRRNRRLSAVIGVAAALALTGLVAFLIRGKLGLGGSKAQHLQIGVAPAERLSTTTEAPAYQPSRTAIAVSPDGRTIVFAGRRLDQASQDQRLFRRSVALDTSEAEPIAGSEGGSCPFFSPDGRWIGFVAEKTLRKVSVHGGSPIDICPIKDFYGASWGDDDGIIFGQDALDGLWRVPAAGGGEAKPLTALDRGRGEISHRLPFVMPGAKAVLFTVLRKTSVNWLEAEAAVMPLGTGSERARILAEDAADARFMPPGILLFMRRGALMAAPFDAEALALTGGTAVAVKDVMQTINTGHRGSDTGAGQYAVSGAGTLAYVLGGMTRRQLFNLAWRDLAGKLDMLSLESNSYLMPQISPDGKRALIWTMTLPRTIWLIDLERQVPMALAVEGGASFPIWSPDGRAATFLWATAKGFSLARMPVDGPALPEVLLTADKLVFPLAWSRDGRVLMYQDSEGEMRLLESVGGKWESRPWTQPKQSGEAVCFSPDGRWAAYDSYDGQNERFKLYVARFPDGGAKQLITTEPAVHPVWSPSGRELYFTLYSGGGEAPHKFVSVPVIPGDPPVFGRPRILFEAKWGLTGPGRAYDLSPNGRRILFVLPDQRPFPDPPNEIHIVTRWPDEFRARRAAD